MNIRRDIKPLLTAVALIFLVGCSSEDSPTSSSDNNDTRSVKTDPSFAADIQEIFTRRGCTGGNCHGSATQAGLDLRSGAAYDELLNEASSQTGGDRVTPFDAENSYLVIKVEGRQSIGERMPFGGPALDSIDIQNIRNWIDNGAENN